MKFMRYMFLPILWALFQCSGCTSSDPSVCTVLLDEDGMAFDLLLDVPALECEGRTYRQALMLLASNAVARLENRSLYLVLLQRDPAVSHTPSVYASMGTAIAETRYPPARGLEQHLHMALPASNFVVQLRILCYGAGCGYAITSTDSADVVVLLGTPDLIGDSTRVTYSVTNGVASHGVTEILENLPEELPFTADTGVAYDPRKQMISFVGPKHSPIEALLDAMPFGTKTVFLGMTSLPAISDLATGLHALVPVMHQSGTQRRRAINDIDDRGDVSPFANSDGDHLQTGSFADGVRP
jgi:hypothetical protein